VPNDGPKPRVGGCGKSVSFLLRIEEFRCCAKISNISIRGILGKYPAFPGWGCSTAIHHAVCTI
jgi:hypothetical protein